MNRLSAVLLFLGLAASVARAQENMFSTHPGSNTVTVVDAQKFAALPTTGAFGPNPIATTGSPQTILHDAARGQIYIISTTGGTVMAYDTLRFTSKSVTPPNLTGPLTTGTMDSRYLYAVGTDTVAGKVGVYRFDLDNFTSAGVTFVGGLTPAGATTYTPVDVDVVQGKAYFTYSSLFSGALAILIYHVGEVDLSTGAFQDVFAVNNTSTTQPRAFTKISRSSDGQMALVAATTQSTGGVGWQLLRINPASAPVVDVLNFASGCSPTAPEDLVFTTSTSPYTVCMLAADDCSYALRFFTVGPTGPASVISNGAAIPAGFGQDLTPDLSHNRIFVGNTSAGNTIQFVTPATTAGVFLGAAVNTGAQSPTGAVVVPAPPTLILSTVSQPAGVVTTPFQIEMTGSGFIQGSSRGILFDPGGNPFLASSTQVVNSGRLIATFPNLAVIHYDVGVVNNDGQQERLAAYYQGMTNPTAGNLPVSLPSLAQGYRLLSFPEYATVGDLRAAATAQLGQYNPIFYRIFLWRGNGYIELNNTKLSPSLSLMGTGIFALSRDGATLDLGAPGVTANSTAPARVVVIQPGWNIISQPWTNGLTSTMAYSSLLVHALGDLTDTGVAATSVTSGVSTVLYEASGGVYVTSTVMTAGRAYWILNQTGGPLYLVYTQSAVSAKALPLAKTAPVPLSETPPPFPGSSLDSNSTGGGGGCGLLGAEALLAVLFLRLRRRRTLAA